MMRRSNGLKFLAGALCASTIFIMVGARTPDNVKHRFSVDVDTVLGGMSGMTVEVTDHVDQKLYLYMWGGEKAENPTLAATIDLTTAGNEELKVEIPDGP